MTITNKLEPQARDCHCHSFGYSSKKEKNASSVHNRNANQSFFLPQKEKVLVHIPGEEKVRSGRNIELRRIGAHVLSTLSTSCAVLAEFLAIKFQSRKFHSILKNSPRKFRLDSLFGVMKIYYTVARTQPGRSLIAVSLCDHISEELILPLYFASPSGRSLPLPLLPGLRYPRAGKAKHRAISFRAEFEILARAYISRCTASEPRTRSGHRH